MEEIILAWLAEGAVSYAGGTALKSIMGDHMLSDIENMIKSAIHEINSFTKKTIDENEIRKLVASMDSVKRNLTEYSYITDQKNQMDNKFLIEDAIIKTSDAVSQCRTLGIDAIICYAYAVSMNIIAKISFHKLVNSVEARRSIDSIIMEAKKSIEMTVPPFIASLDPSRRISEPNPPCSFVSGDGGQAGYGKCWLIIDGSRVQVYDGLELERYEWQEIVSQYISDAESVRQQAISKIDIPLQNAIISWSKAGSMLR